MTPLQTAAQYVIDRQTPGWANTEPTAQSIEMLRKALSDEQAQAVEPVAWLRHDSFKAMTDDEKSAWIESGNSDVVEEYTTPLYTTPLHLHSAPPPAGERAELIYWLRERSMWDD